MPITKASGQAVAPAAKGDLVVGSATNDAAVLAVGSANQVLTVDSSTTTGLKWAAVSGGAGNMAQIATGTLSSSSVTISSLDSYTELLLHIYSATTDAAGTTNIRVNNNSGSNYDYIGAKWEGTNAPSRISQQSVGEINLISNQNLNSSAQQAYAIRFFNCKNPGFTSFDTTIASQGTSTFNVAITKGVYKVSEAVSSLRIFHSGGNWTAGTYILWGA